jgi:hypothetical protein
VNIRSPLIVFALICATIVSFFWGGYHALMPLLFLSGLSLVSVICLWASSSMDTRSLVTLAIVSMVLAAVDEYAHTSSGVFRYFDGMTPSFLAVFGWSLFVLGIVATAQFLHQRIPLGSLDGSASRVLLALMPFFLLIVLARVQGYLRFFGPLLISVYFFLFTASLYYSCLHQFGWCVWVVISSLFFSATMEYLGGIESLWVYQYNEPIAFFIVFTWTLRVLTILAVSSLLGVEIQE